MSHAAPPRARVTRGFTQTPARVFDAWLQPESIATWMFGPRVRDEEIVRLTIDARVGGSFSFVVRRQGQEFDHIGEYLEIDRPRRLAFTWAVRQEVLQVSRVIVDIVALDRGCELTLTHELHSDWASFVAQSEAAWGKMLDALAAALDESKP